MISVELVGDRELIVRLEAMPGGVRQNLARAVTKLGHELQHHVQADKLSGQVLKVRSGKLRASIHTEMTQTATEVAATVGTNVRYARPQELGVPHNWLIAARNARSLRFQIGGRTLFRRSITHPPLPEHSFLRSALADMRPAIEAGLTEAVAAGLRE